MVLPVSMDATWLDGSVQFNGQELRRADSGLFVGEGSTPLGVHGGIVRHSDSSLLVTVNASDVITVQPGAIVIPGNSGVANGVYRSALAAADTGTLTARNATNPRIDLVVFRALDTSVVAGHGAYTGRIEIITGTAAASPVVPTLPAMAQELARITVPATGGGTATVDLTYREFAAAIGGTVPVPTAARLPATPNAKWLRAVAIDTGVEYVWNSTAWVAQGALTSVTPTLDVNVSAVGPGVIARKINGMVTFTYEVQNAFAWSGAWQLVTLPVGYRPLNQMYFMGGNGSLNQWHRMRLDAGGLLFVTDPVPNSSQILLGSVTFPAA